jgi:WhiB family redox-sensing transcriptional regulator
VTFARGSASPEWRTKGGPNSGGRPRRQTSPPTADFPVMKAPHYRDRNRRAHWTERAACRGDASHLFFAPPAREVEDVRAKRERVAKSICARCPVKSPCVAYALQVNEALGIWGGTTEAERRQLSVNSSAPSKGTCTIARSGATDRTPGQPMEPTPR